MLTTYPDSNNLSTYAAGFSQKADFGRFHSIGLQFDDYTATSRGLTAANWGNRIIRTATRRRHADSRLLVLPNPHHCRHGGRRRARLRCPWAVAGPGRASRRRAERSSRRGRRAGGPPPTGTPSSPALTDHAGGNDATARKISHVIYRGHFSRRLKNVAIPTM